MNDRSGTEVRQGLGTLMRLLRYLRRYRGYTVLALLSLVAMAGFDVLRPLLIMYVVDHVIVTGDIGLLVPLIAAIIGVSLAHGGATFALTYLRRLLGERVIYDIRNELYSHLHYLDTKFHDNSRTGELMSRTGTDVQAVRRLMSFGLMSVVKIFISLAFTLAAGLSLSPILMGIVVLTGPGLYLTVRSFRRQIKPAFLAIHEQNANLSATLQENVAGIRVVRSFGQENQEIAHFGSENWETLERHLTAAKIRSRHAPILDFWGYLSRAILLLAGGWMVISGQVTIGVFVAIDRYLARLMQPIKESHGLIDMMGEAMSSGERIFELLDTEPAIADPDKAITPRKVRGEVRFDRVSFAYDNEPALRDIDLTVHPGETVAIIGGTGSGKTSLVQLVNRAYDPTQGRVLLDNQDLRDFSVQDLRRRIAVIHQESFLFSATLYENIAYGRPEASLEEVEDAARRARAHEFISELPHGYETLVGERGAGLSGGQKQRITIARALVMRPDVMIMDDATSAVDMETEFLIWEALGEAIRECTTFIVAQRLSTIRNVDRIVVMEHGRIAEVGTHDELMARDALYARMYRIQVEDARDEVASDRRLVELTQEGGSSLGAH